MRRRTFLTAGIGAAGAAGLAAALGGCTATSGGSTNRRHPPVPGQCSPAPGEDRQLRGAWIGTFKNIDWPSRPGLSAGPQQRELTGLLDVAAGLGLNAVLLQIRPTADALYPSPYEPWSKWLTGAQGRSPGYDPLQFAIDAAHGRGLELHAWFNPFRVSEMADLAGLVAAHPARQHPEWVVGYAGQVWYDPGHPAARDLALRVVADVTRRYDIDGVHLDDYFYPYPVAGHVFGDDLTFRRYGAGFGSRAAWRRHNVDLLVAGIAGEVRRERPWLKFGVSPFGIWRNRSSDPAGSRTSGLQAYDDLYTDARTWIRAGWLDYVAPQLYWQISDRAAPYTELVRWWSAAVSSTGTELYIGQAAYQAADPGRQWPDPGELSRHLAFDRTQPEVTGELFFHTRSLAAGGPAVQLVRRQLAAHRDPPIPQRLRRWLAAPAQPPPAGWLRREVLATCSSWRA